MQRLDLATCPLHGTRLIEASAGTGKTFTLTALYLRLLLERDIDVDHLLVVTFTEAATEELRSRIRSRLREAAAGFENGASDDPVVASLLARLDDHTRRAQQLRDTVTRLDEAAIFTIHGFCRRMLTEHAFESGALFDTALTTDEQTLQQAVISDFWRRRFYDGDSELAAWVTRRWATPGKLLESLKPWLRNAAPRVLPAADRAQVEAAEAAVATCFTAARASWTRDRKAIIDAINGLVAEKSLSRAQKGGYPPERVAALAALADEYFAADTVPYTVPTELRLLTPATLESALTKAAHKAETGIPAYPFFSDCETLIERSAALDILHEVALLCEAARYLQEALQSRKRESRQWTFNDLLADLEQALHGPGGARLASAIRSRFPAALVDEFQDTDPLQYRILKAIYDDDPQSGAWFMIGDPKQAIYGFRGADIFTYIQARRDTDPAAHLTLDTNWRSAAGLVTAVNALFGRIRAPFIFDEDIRFLPVEPNPRGISSPLAVDDRPPAPLTVWFVEQQPERLYRGTISRKWALENVAPACAGEIARLIRLGREGRARLGDQPLRAADLAVLVRNHEEASTMRRALAAAGVNSVYFSRESVFATEEALALEQILAAVAEPGDERRLRAALASNLVGADAHALAAQADAPEWLDWLTQFQTYHELWTSAGFMTFFQCFLREQKIPARLLGLPQGERRLTDLLQLAELAQRASETTPGMDALLRWLGEHIRCPDAAADEQQLRLESDAGLVRIVTVHKSKGLEYPVVFLPFIWGSRPRQERNGDRPAIVDFHAPADRAYTLDLGSAEHAAHHALSERERLAEDLRLLYVALTRARHCCYLAWGQFHRAATSALGHLLHPAEDGAPIGSGMQNLDDGALRAPWEALSTATRGAIRVDDLPASEHLDSPAGMAPEALCARRFDGQVPQGWRIASYSGLVAGRGAYAPETPDHDAVDTADDTPAPRAEPAAPFSSIFQFPRGARAGTFMHALLERVDFPGAGGAELATLAEHLLQRHGFDVRWRPVVTDMVTRVLDTPLGSDGSLREVPAGKRRVEMEFYFPLDEVTHTAIDRFITARRGESTGAGLGFGTVAGMMKGFIDLIFERDGRYFIIDYKSNHLGDRADDYRHDSLVRAIRGHQYDLQYLIYTVALHRYLSRRLPGYDYTRHFGGVYYLFLRGMDERGNGVFHDCPAPDDIAALDRIFDGG